LAEVIGTPDGDHWSISKAVGPGQGGFADVVLVQSMLKIFLTSPALVDTLPGSDRDLIDKIFTATIRSGGKFADGIYGSNTRAALGILERKIDSPVKDGIVRPYFEGDLLGRESGLRGTKMRELNTFWNESVLADAGGSKKESGRQLLSPSLFSQLYPNG